MSLCATNAGNQEELLKNAPDDCNNKNRKKRILRRTLMSLGVFFCLFAGVLFFFKVSKVCNSFVYELGDNVSTEVTDYLSGRPFALSLAKINMPDISNEIPGEYTVSVDYLFSTYYYSVTVQDTIAPIVEFKSDSFVCEVNTETDALFFVEQTIDKCPILKYEYINIENDEDVIISDDKYCFIATSAGVHYVVLKVSDYAGNYTTYYLSIVSDTAPTIEGIMEYYCSTAVSPNLLAGVYAYDERYGETEVSYACSASSFTIPGDYIIDYSATNKIGLTSHKEGVLHVYSPLVLQDLINTGKIDNDEINVFGVINPYDCGYVSDSNIYEAIDLIRTSVIYIQYDNGNSRTNGSGFIVDIDSSDITICTNNHVVKDQETVYVSFFDGITVPAGVIATQKTPDIAFIRVSKSSLPGATLEKLKTVHINLGYYNSLSNNPNFDMGMYCINYDGSERAKRVGKIVRKSGKLSEYFVGYDYAVTEVSIPLTPGVSGSAIIDTHGNLLCMAAFYWDHDNSMEYYGISLDDILDFYEKTFGERLEYY